MFLDDVLERLELDEKDGVCHVGAVLLKTDKFLEAFPTMSDWKGARQYEGHGEYFVYATYKNKEFFCSMKENDYEAMSKNCPKPLTIKQELLPLQTVDLIVDTVTVKVQNIGNAYNVKVVRTQNNDVVLAETTTNNLKA